MVKAWSLHELLQKDWQILRDDITICITEADQNLCEDINNDPQPGEQRQTHSYSITIHYPA